MRAVTQHDVEQEHGGSGIAGLSLDPFPSQRAVDHRMWAADGEAVFAEISHAMLGAVTELHEGDLSIGHRRVYTPADFQQEIRDAGLAVDRFGGVFIKILSNAQSATTFSDDQLRALLVIGERYPAIAAEMYVVAKLA